MCDGRSSSMFLTGTNLRDRGLEEELHGKGIDHRRFSGTGGDHL
jgi:hypothetical protein